MSNSNINPPPDLDPNQLMRLLELELAHKRAEWKQASSRVRTNRVNAIVMLVALLLAIAVAFFFFY